jgi:hypothetical protein
MSSGSFTCGVVWRAIAVRVTVLEGVRCTGGENRSLLWKRMGSDRTAGKVWVIDAKYSTT